MTIHTVYGKALQTLGEAGFNLTSDTLKVMLCTSTYTPNKDTHRYKSDVTNEVIGTGYTAGGATLVGVAWTYNSASDRMELTATNTVWDPLTTTTRFAVAYKDTGTGSTSPLISYVDFEVDKSPSAVPFTLDWDDTGLLRIAAA